MVEAFHSCCCNGVQQLPVACYLNGCNTTLHFAARQVIKICNTKRISAVVPDTPGTVQAGYVVPRPHTPPQTSFQQATTSGTGQRIPSINSAGRGTSSTGITTRASDTSNGDANNFNTVIPQPDANTGEATNNYQRKQNCLEYELEFMSAKKYCLE